MKKLMLIFGILLLSSIVIAEFEGTGPHQNQRILLREGWNLVSMYAVDNLADIDQSDYDRDELKDMGVKAGFIFDPYSQRYINTYPNMDKEEYMNFLLPLDPEEGGSIDGYVRFVNSAMWVYVDQTDEFRFNAYDGPAKVSDVKLVEGWNFLSVTPDMKGRKFSELTGDCDLKKVYSFESIIQEWSDNLLNDGFMDETITESAVWQGMVIKVDQACKLGASSVAPPELPKEPIKPEKCLIPMIAACEDFVVRDDEVVMKLRSKWHENTDMEIDISGCLPVEEFLAVGGDKTLRIPCDTGDKGEWFERSVVFLVDGHEYTGEIAGKIQ